MTALIREEIVNGERLIEMGASVLVASKSDAGGWYEIRDGHCQCQGFRFRGRCSHTAAVRALEVQVAKEVAADLAAMTPESRVPTGRAALAFMQLADD